MRCVSDERQGVLCLDYVCWTGPRLSRTFILLIHCRRCLVKCGYVRHFVMISANCPSVLVYAKSITSLLCQYLMTWCLTSMCFVLLVVIKFVDILMQAWLSSRNRMGSSICIPSSARADRSHITALHASSTVRYSAEAVDWAGAPGCSLQLKSITSPLSITKKPHLLRRVSGQGNICALCGRFSCLLWHINNYNNFVLLALYRCACAYWFRHNLLARYVVCVGDRRYIF